MTVTNTQIYNRGENMIIDAVKLKDACKKINSANEKSGLSTYIGKVELKTDNSILYMNITNAEYFVEVKIQNTQEEFHATVDADLFVKLITKLSTDNIEMTTTDTSLFISAVDSKVDGKYHLPLITDGNGVDTLSLPKIEINNPTATWTVDWSILNDILQNNSKEVLKALKFKGPDVKAQNLKYYIDKDGCITYYKGACVNKFDFKADVKMLLNHNIVKLFPLLENDSQVVECTIGYDALSNDITQTKVKFKTDVVCITAITDCDDSLIKQIPVSSIREVALTDYVNKVTVDRNQLLSAIGRLLLYNDSMNSTATCKMTFNKDKLELNDTIHHNIEVIPYTKELNSDRTYEAFVDLFDIASAIESHKDILVSIGFGQNNTMVLGRLNVYVVIPELV